MRCAASSLRGQVSAGQQIGESKMKLNIESLDTNCEVELTTDSPKSSYGLPVLRVDGNDYGPCDWVGGQLLAGDLAVLAKLPGTRAFLQQSPNASKWWNLESVTA